MFFRMMNNIRTSIGYFQSINNQNQSFNSNRPCNYFCLLPLSFDTCSCKSSHTPEKHLSCNKRDRSLLIVNICRPIALAVRCDFAALNIKSLTIYRFSCYIQPFSHGLIQLVSEVFVLLLELPHFLLIAVEILVHLCLMINKNIM